MHKALIHIGTEKTGSTSIQNFLYKNESELNSRGFFYPYKSCGLISNYRLVLFSLDQPDEGLAVMEKARAARARWTQSEAPCSQEWKTKFANEHEKHIKQLRKGLSTSTVVYSSEHFHSRVHKVEEIRELKTYLDTLYDSVEVCLYMRRQDRLAISAHNTAIQGGRSSSFSFSDIKGTPNYYNYHALINRWAQVFGSENIHPNIYRPSLMEGGNVVHDFVKKFVYAGDIAETQFKFIEGDRSNPRLSYSALCTLVEFNKLTEDDPLLEGHAKTKLRKKLIDALHGLKDEYGELLPQRDSAINFYDRFREANQMILDKWPAMGAFSDEFDMYTASANTHPNIDSKTLLSNTLKPLLR